MAQHLNRTRDSLPGTGSRVFAANLNDDRDNYGTKFSESMDFEKAR